MLKRTHCQRIGTKYPPFSPQECREIGLLNLKNPVQKHRQKKTNPQPSKLYQIRHPYIFSPVVHRRSHGYGWTSCSLACWGLGLSVPSNVEVRVVGHLPLWCHPAPETFLFMGLHRCFFMAWRRGRPIVHVQSLKRTTWTSHLLECTEESPSRFAHTWNQESTRTHNNSKRLH